MSELKQLSVILTVRATLSPKDIRRARATRHTETYMTDNKPQYFYSSGIMTGGGPGYEFYSRKLFGEKQLRGKYGDSKTALTCWVSQVQWITCTSPPRFFGCPSSSYSRGSDFCVFMALPSGLTFGVFYLDLKWLTRLSHSSISWLPAPEVHPGHSGTASCPHDVVLLLLHSSQGHARRSRYSHTIINKIYWALLISYFVHDSKYTHLIWIRFLWGWSFSIVHFFLRETV